MVIKVIGMGCENCDKLYENVMEAVKETGSDGDREAGRHGGTVADDRR